MDYHLTELDLVSSGLQVDPGLELDLNIDIVDLNIDIVDLNIDIVGLNINIVT